MFTKLVKDFEWICIETCLSFICVDRRWSSTQFYAFSMFISIIYLIFTFSMSNSLISRQHHYDFNSCTFAFSLFSTSASPHLVRQGIYSCCYINTYNCNSLCSFFTRKKLLLLVKLLLSTRYTETVKRSIGKK